MGTILVGIIIGLALGLLVSFARTKWTARRITRALQAIPLENQDASAGVLDALSVLDWQVTGHTVGIPQYSMAIEIHWTDREGERHVHSDTYRYPDDITAMPLTVRRHFAEQMITATARVAIGLNGWEAFT